MSPITSSARNDQQTTTEREPAPQRSEEAAAHFEGMLFAGALAPLSQALGVLGDVLTDAVATAVVRGSHDAFYRHLQTLAARTEGDERP